MLHKKLFARAAALIALLLLAGCIPVPTTQQYMMNGKLKPSWKVGHGSGNPIQLGHTSILEAMDYLSSYTAGPTTMDWERGDVPMTASQVRASWRKVGKYKYGLLYHRQAWTLFMLSPPFGAWPLDIAECIVLKTNDAQCVVDYDIISEGEFRGEFPYYAPVPALLEDLKKPWPPH